MSGANLAVVAGTVTAVARGLGLGARVVPLLSATAMLGFVVVARPQPSLVRALVMGLITLVGVSGGRERSALRVLPASVLLLVLADPWLARSFGFALSVLASAGIVVLAPGWRDRVLRTLPARAPPRLAGLLADAVAVPAAAQVACAPVLVLLAGRVSLVAVVANVLAAPAVGPVTVLGVVAAAVAPVWPAGARAAAWAAGVPAGWIAQVARHGARMPLATVPWPAGWTGGCLLVVVVLTGLWVVPSVLPLLVRTRQGRRLAAVAALGATLGAALPGVAAPAWPPRDWFMVACDVGQGDGLVLRAGPGQAVVVDTGPDPALMDGCLRSLGVGDVRDLVLTHFHADHVEGVPGVLRGRRVEAAEVTLADDPPAEAVRVSRWLSAAHVPENRVAVGERRTVGDVTWRVVWPGRVITGTDSLPNNESVVLDVWVRGVHVLMTGDVEREAQQALAPALAGETFDVLKVPHHGSANQLPALLLAARPRVAVISVGLNNDYGHPAISTVSLLRSAGAVVARTDLDGAVALAGTPDALRVVPLGR